MQNDENEIKQKKEINKYLNNINNNNNKYIDNIYNQMNENELYKEMEKSNL